MDAGTENNDPDIAVEEPENSTVEDWFGQDVARDEEVAERAVRENDTLEEAEEQFEQEAEGKETHELGYPRPEGDDDGGSAGGSSGSDDRIPPTPGA